MGNFLSQFNDLVNRDGDAKVPDVQLDFEGKAHAQRERERERAAILGGSYLPWL